MKLIEYEIFVYFYTKMLLKILLVNIFSKLAYVYVPITWLDYYISFRIFHMVVILETLP